MSDTATLTYNYGETPREVIAQRWSHALAFEPNADDHMLQWVLAAPGSSQLITTLESLLFMSAQPWGTTRIETRIPRKLRIDILAALGIEES